MKSVRLNTPARLSPSGSLPVSRDRIWVAATRKRLSPTARVTLRVGSTAGSQFQPPILVHFQEPHCRPAHWR
jgi:hypothetical protein